MHVLKLGRGHYAVRLGGRRVVIQRATTSVWQIRSSISGEVLTKRIGLKAAYRQACSILRKQRREEALHAARFAPKVPALI